MEAGMARSFWGVAAAAVLALAAPAWSQSAATSATGPMIRPQGLKSVSPHVQVIPDESRPLVANTGLGPENGALVYAAAVRAAPGRKVYLVATHAHPEHDLGAQAFPAGTVMIRSTAQAADAADQEPRLTQLFSNMNARNAEL